MRPTRRAFLPALLLGLLLGAALVARLLGPPVTDVAGGTRGATTSGVETAIQGSTAGEHHIAAGGTPVSGAVTAPAHHAADPRPIGAQLAARPADVRFCVGASLEPFAASWAQLQALGPDEAAERARRCFMELIFTHVDPATAQAVRDHAPAVAACYRQLLTGAAPAQDQAIARTTTCLTSPTAQAP